MFHVLEHHLILKESYVKMTFYGQIVPYSLLMPSLYYFQGQSSHFYKSVIFHIENY